MKPMKKVLALCVAVLMLVSTINFPVALAVEPENEALVYTLEDLQTAITNNQDVTLGRDIEVSTWTYLNGEYSATLNGNGYTMDCSSLNTKTTGLIKTLTGTVKNLTIKGMTVNATSNVRGILCHENKGTISHVNMVDVTISNTGNYTGCVAGRNYGTIAYVNVINANMSGTTGENEGGITGRVDDDASISYCTVSGTVGGKNHVGGIVGYAATGSTVIGCVNYANTTASGGRVGGIAGTLQTGTSLSYCINYGTIRATPKSATRLVGGIATVNAAWTASPIVSYCLNAGKVIVYEANEAYAGAILGGNTKMSGQYVSKCYALSNSVSIINVDGGTGAETTNQKTIASDDTAAEVMVFNGVVVDSLTAALVDAEHLTDAFTYTSDATYPITVKIAHTHTTEAVTPNPATCTEAGNIAYWRCNVCGKYYSDSACSTEITLADTVLPAGHSWVDASCTEPKHCTVCWITEGEALSHDVSHKEASGAECVKDGNLEYWYCSRCEQYYKDAECTDAYDENAWLIVAPGHQWNDAIPKTCTVCGAASCEESGHSLTHKEATGASCTEDGNLEYWYCSGCGKYFKDEACENEHAEGAWRIPASHTATKTGAQEASCTADGNHEYWYCSVCDEYYQDENCTTKYAENAWLIPGGHTAEHTEEKPASCAEMGNLEYWYCSACEKYFKDEACTDIYDEGAWLVTVAHTMTKKEAAAASTTADGNIACWYCSVCEKHFTDESATQELPEDAWRILATPITGKGNIHTGGHDESVSGAGAIGSEADLLNMIKAVTADKKGVGLSKGYWYLTSNITVSSWTQIPYFNGTLDGNGYTITFANELTTGEALIKKTGSKAVIKDLTIANLNMAASGEKMAAVIEENNGIFYCITINDLAVTTTNNNIAGVIYINKGKVCDIMVDGITVNGTKDIGGICHENKGTISDVTVLNAKITGNSDRAAIIACINNKGTIKYCVTYGEVTSKYHVGGIVARGDGSIQRCINYADITATHSRVAGIVASALKGCTIKNCGNYGTILSKTAGGKTAGIVNLLDNKATGVSVTNCFNAGQIWVGKATATGVGAIAGNAVADMTVKNCYAVENMIFCSADNAQYPDASVADAKNGTLITKEAFADKSMAGKLNADAFIYLSESVRSVALKSNPNPKLTLSPGTGDEFLMWPVVALMLCSGVALILLTKKRFSV